MIRVLVCDPVSEEAVKVLEEAGFVVDIKPGLSPNILVNLVGEYDVIIVRGSTKITSEIIDAGIKLKIIARAGSGLDNIAVNYAKEKGIKILNAPEGNANAVAELTIGLILALLRKIPQANIALKEGTWQRGLFKGLELKERTVGVIGLGNVGSLVARKLRCLGCRVIGFKRSNLHEVAKRLGIIPAKDINHLLAVSDIITLHVPLTKETWHMIGEQEFNIMKNGVFLVNTSRGQVIDGKALLKAINEGKVAGAALDVFWHEPPREEWEWRLIKHPNVIAVPHIGSMTEEAERNVGLIIARKIIKALKSS
ncbi:MAG: 3-phosphoglycerate dehydrogenase [Thermoprotei archaeon]|nr:MAG: 3-phosphoglycerate dehydrogenase [Thermoprotei archaeon]